MGREVPTGVVALVVIAVALVIGIVGYSVLGRKPGQLTTTEQKQSEQSAEQEYRQYYRGGKGSGGAGSPYGAPGR